MNDTVLLIPAIMGVVFVLAGVLLFMLPPKKINNIYGYRTRRSRTSPEHWRYAQHVAAKELLLIGPVLVLVSNVNSLFSLTESAQQLISITLAVSVVGLLFFRVEQAIKNKFDRSGQE